MNLKFTPSAWDDYLWFQQRDRKLLKRINQLLDDIRRTPFERIRDRLAPIVDKRRMKIRPERRIFQERVHARKRTGHNGTSSSI
jgi:Txe/YoeB family toxin of Txe-Axe toxin-antitoxin module